MLSMDIFSKGIFKMTLSLNIKKKKNLFENGSDEMIHDYFNN